MIQRWALLLTLTTVCLVRAAWADPTASVDRETVRLNESFTFTLRIEGDAPVDPDFGVLESCCEILNSSRKTQIQSVNRQYERVTEWQLVLMANETGTLQIPSIEIGNVRSNPVELTVVPPQTGNAPGAIFIEVEATPQHPYVQAETVYAVRLFVGTETDIRGPRLSEPQVDGGEAIIEKLGEDRRYRTERGGQGFDVIERRFSVLPQVAGSLTIEPLTFETQVLDGRRFSRIQRFRSDAIELMVKPIEAPPVEFPNADWLPARDVKLQESWSREPEGMIAGVPLTRTITIQADGLLETQLPELELASTDGVKQYRDQPSLDRVITTDGIRGVRMETMAVIAGEPGEFGIDALELPWFDVDAERWEIARLEDRRLSVAANGEQPPPVLIDGQVDDGLETPLAASTSVVWRWTSFGLAAGWLLTTLFFLLRGRPNRRTSPSPRAEAPTTSLRTVLRKLRKACRDNNAVDARRWVLEWAARYFPDRPPRNLSALAEQVPGTLAEPLRELDRHFYGRSESGPWTGAALLDGVKTLDSVQTRAGDGDQDPLVPLYRT